MHDADIDLMIFALRNCNELFLKEALSQIIFDNLIVDNQAVINEFIEILK